MKANGLLIDCLVATEKFRRSLVRHTCIRVSVRELVDQILMYVTNAVTAHISNFS